jgi:hypothetical protein
MKPSSSHFKIARILGGTLVCLAFLLVLFSCGASDSEKVKIESDATANTDVELIETGARDIHYVNGAIATSGDGATLLTAWKTINEAMTSSSLQAGSLVLVYPGVYAEALTLNVSGDEIIPMEYDVALSDGNTLTFNNASVDLSSIDLSNDIDEYYLYVYRSMKSNNGVFKITSVSSGNRQVTVEGTSFIDESSSAGNAYDLSAGIGKPIVFMNASQTPDVHRIIVSASGLSDINAVLYVGHYSDPRTATPVQYTIVDGFELTASSYSPGVRIQNSSYNTVRNCKIYNTGISGLEEAAGVQIGGSESKPARYNTIAGNTIYNTPRDGVQLGTRGFPQTSNQVLFTHIMDNTIHTSGSAAYARLDNGVDINAYNLGSVVESNTFQDFNLYSGEDAVVNIGSAATYTLVYNNTFKNIGAVSVQQTNYLIGINGSNNYINVFNNLLYNESVKDNDIYAFRVDGSDLYHTLIAHNTIFQVDNGLLLEDYSGNVQVYLYNNIIDVSGDHITNWGTAGNFNLQSNLYSADPGTYASESGRLTGDPGFSSEATSDFNLTAASIAVDKAVATSPSITIDFNKNARSGVADIGAFELVQ